MTMSEPVITVHQAAEIISYAIWSDKGVVHGDATDAAQALYDAGRLATADQDRVTTDE